MLRAAHTSSQTPAQHEHLRLSCNVGFRDLRLASAAPRAAHASSQISSEHIQVPSHESRMLAPLTSPSQWTLIYTFHIISRIRISEGR